MSGSKNKVFGLIDVSLKRNHHNYYGEEADPDLAWLLFRANKDPVGTNKESVTCYETLDLIASAVEVHHVSIPTRSNPPVIGAENVQIINEGDNAENEEGSVQKNNENESASINTSSAVTPRSINVRPTLDEMINSSMSVSVRDQQSTTFSVAD